MPLTIYKKKERKNAYPDEIRLYTRLFNVYVKFLISCVKAIGE